MPSGGFDQHCLRTGTWAVSGHVRPRRRTVAGRPERLAQVAFRAATAWCRCAAVLHGEVRPTLWAPGVGVLVLVGGGEGHGAEGGAFEVVGVVGVGRVWAALVMAWRMPPLVGSLPRMKWLRTTPCCWSVNRSCLLMWVRVAGMSRIGTPAARCTSVTLACRYWGVEERGDGVAGLFGDEPPTVETDGGQRQAVTEATKYRLKPVLAGRRLDCAEYERSGATTARARHTSMATRWLLTVADCETRGMSVA